MSPERVLDIFQTLEQQIERKNTQLLVADAELSELSAVETDLSAVKTELSAVETELQSTKDELRELKEQANWLRHQLFGARSERRALEVLTVADQLWLGEQFLEVPEEPPAKKTTVRQYERNNRSKPTNLVDEDSQLRFDDNVPVEIVEVEDPRFKGVPESEIVVVDERVTYRLAQRSPYVVLKIVQKVAKLKGEEAVSCPPIPAAVFPGSSADVSFLASMVTDKYCCHLPVYRQHQRLESGGVFIERSTMTRLVHRTGELLEPIYNALTSSVLSSFVLGIDETPTPAGTKNKKIRKGYYWVFYGDREEVFFLFSPSRGQAVIDKVLEGFQGKLLTDGYVVYDNFCKKNEGVVLCNCWSHTRREFLKAEKLEPEKVSRIILELQKLYRVERWARHLSPEDRLTLRRKYSEPIVMALFQDFQRELEETSLLPSNSYLNAIEYALNRKKELLVFLEDPAVQIDTNHVERQLRGQAIGRKNWMFHFTEVGARHGAVFFSLIQSCRLAGVDPTTYLIDILQRIDTHPAADVHQLIPRNWKELFSANPMKSLLDSMDSS